MKKGIIVFLTLGLISALSVSNTCGEDLWQIGVPNGFVNPIIGAGEFPADFEYSDTFEYTVGTDIDPITEPSMPGYIGPQNVCGFVSDNRPCTDTTALLYIHFTLYCPYEAGELTLTYGRYGSESDILSLDGNPLSLGNPAGEGNFAEYEVDFGAIGPGDHTLTIEYNGGGDDNGHYIDYLKLSSDVTCDRVPFCAGQNEDIGEVTVKNDGANNLTITYLTDYPWFLAETHLATSLDEGGIPVNKKNNPVPGHFMYSNTHSPTLQEYSYYVQADCINEGSIDIAAHAAVIGIQTAAPYPVHGFLDYSQGLKKDGTEVNVGRSIPSQGFDYETTQAESSFFSLGFEGWIELAFDCPVVDGEGNDIQIVEDTWGSYPLEKAEVWVKQKLEDPYVYLGYADNTNLEVIHTFSEFDINTVGLEWIKYIKVVDETDPSPHNSGSDGFDLNAVLSLQDCVKTETAWGDGCDGQLFNEKGNWATYFTYDLICP